jgi:hypothetical protein
MHHSLPLTTVKHDTTAQTKKPGFERRPDVTVDLARGDKFSHRITISSEFYRNYKISLLIIPDLLEYTKQKYCWKPLIKKDEEKKPSFEVKSNKGETPTDIEPRFVNGTCALYIPVNVQEQILKVQTNFQHSLVQNIKCAEINLLRLRVFEYINGTFHCELPNPFIYVQMRHGRTDVNAKAFNEYISKILGRNVQELLIDKLNVRSTLNSYLSENIYKSFVPEESAFPVTEMDAPQDTTSIEDNSKKRSAYVMSSEGFENTEIHAKKKIRLSDKTQDKEFDTPVSFQEMRVIQFFKTQEMEFNTPPSLLAHVKLGSLHLFDCDMDSTVNGEDQAGKNPSCEFL